MHFLCWDMKRWQRQIRRLFCEIKIGFISMTVRCLMFTLDWSYTLLVAENICCVQGCASGGMWCCCLMTGWPVQVKLHCFFGVFLVFCGLSWGWAFCIHLGCLFCPLSCIRPLGSDERCLGAHSVLARLGWKASCLNRAIVITHQAKCPHWRRVRLGNT